MSILDHTFKDPSVKVIDDSVKVIDNVYCSTLTLGVTGGMGLTTPMTLRYTDARAIAIHFGLIGEDCYE